MLATIKREPRCAAWRVRQILFSAAIGVASVAYAGWAQAQTYHVVVDAGSSSSRALIYKIAGSSIALAGNPDEMPKGRALSGDVNGSAAIVKQLLVGEDGQGGVKGWLQRTDHVSPTNVTVDVLATAGMRKVTNSGDVYAAVRKVFESQASFRAGEVRTITGAEEGLYAWIAINDKEGRFAANAKTRGIVEVGGASAQVAFQVAKTGDDVMSITIDSKPYNVYSRSFLGLGANDAWSVVENTKYVSKCREGGAFDFSECRTGYDTAVYEQMEPTAQGSQVKLSFGVSKTALALKQVFPVDDRDKFAGLGNTMKFAAKAGFGGGAGSIDPKCKSGTFSAEYHSCANAVYAESFVLAKLGIPFNKLEVGVDSSWTMGYLIRVVR